jgi:excisionase family DNA binding protein
MPRKINPRRVKTHYTLSIAEWADELGLHKGTIERWVRNDGLLVIADQRPMLIRGFDLREFLEARKAKRSAHIGPSQIYCLGCRRGRKPAGGMLDYFPQNQISGRLEALCPTCGTITNRFIPEADIPAKFPECEVTVKWCVNTLYRCADNLVNVGKPASGQTGSSTTGK